MALTPDVVEQVRDALARADQVDHAGIDVEAAGDTVVLLGAVPSAEQATVAALVAGRHAPDVDNRLGVDRHLREGTPEPGAAGGEQDLRRRPARSEDLSVQASTGEPAVVTSDLHTDADSALAENTPLDPPDAPHGAPTAGEQHGAPDRDTAGVEAADPGEEGDGAKSLPDLSRQDLERAANRRDRDDDRDER